ncbi:hypothetical protein FNV43_RR19512 [Rhamnella rubrinervis]|uniref:MI domain-containing protein n=1 Tax=Rhamnella rubrinervis TaxID=2594499 RepID=A0A8K0DT38_9ROSA|nr:hypothetical protein FNV43_RR19512 [Rhamnella rubrinervis]
MGLTLPRRPRVQPNRYPCDVALPFAIGSSSTSLYFFFFLSGEVVYGSSDLEIRQRSPVLARDPGQAQKNQIRVLDYRSSTLSRTDSGKLVKQCVVVDNTVSELGLGLFYMASHEGFLTDEQREMLKVASHNADTLSSSPKSPTSLLSEHHIKAPPGGKAPTAGIAVRHVRRSHSGKFGRVKKDGGGGKGTWGKLLDTDGESHIDRKDPNYDSGEEPYQLVGSTVSDPLDEYKKALVSIIEEYFSTAACFLAMDRHDKEKEMASVLLSALYANVISPTQIRDGFFMLLESVDDLVVDIPDAVDILALFLARAVVDDILPPAFLTRAKKALPEYSKGFQAIQTAEKRSDKFQSNGKGFSRLEESLDDLALDIPSAKTLFHSLVPKAISEGWLDGSYMKEDEEIRHYKKEAVTIIHEYFLSDDIPELIRSLEDLGAPEHNPIFLKKLITLAMDRKNREKEMASVLLSALHIEIFSTEDIVSGFVLLLESADDTALDILDASNELAFFLARAVIDDVLAPLNLEEIGSKLPPDCSGSEIVGWLGQDNEAVRGRGVNEACQCIRDLGMPFFNHEVVKKALIMAMEKKNDRMLDLLQVGFSEGLITITQMTKGFTRIKDSLDDLALDIPNAKEKFSFYVDHAQKQGWLLPSFGSSPPSMSH